MTTVSPAASCANELYNMSSPIASLLIVIRICMRVPLTLAAATIQGQWVWQWVARGAAFPRRNIIHPSLHLENATTVCLR